MKSNLALPFLARFATERTEGKTFPVGTRMSKIFG
jgi:hypothetical protein